MERVVLAYSGGLDTSVAVKWIQEKYSLDVVTLTVDLGQGQDLEAVRQKALKTGAVEAHVVDAKSLFAEYFVVPSLMAGALYEGRYPLATALGRPLIAKLMVDAARDVGASAVAHGCTGKGNDQVRFDVTFRVLAPDLRVIAPVREWKMSRPEEIEYARKHGIPVDSAPSSGFSVDQNLWGRSIEAGPLEDPWTPPPAAAFEWTAPQGPEPEPEIVEIRFEAGRPVALNGEKLELVELIQQLNRIGGRHRVGRIDHVENRLVGIKTRELYEAPAAVILHAAHFDLEQLTLSKDTTRFKTLVSRAVAELTYDGLWFGAFHQDLMAFVASTQRCVTGDVKVSLGHGACLPVGRRSPFSLYAPELATYGHEDAFDHNAALGFIQLHGLALTNQARKQPLLPGAGDVPRIDLIPPKVSTE